MDINRTRQKQEEIAKNQNSIKFVNDELSDCYFSSSDNESSNSNNDNLDEESSNSNNDNLDEESSNSNNDNLDEKSSNSNNDNLDKESLNSNNDNLDEESLNSNNDNLDEEYNAYVIYKKEKELLIEQKYNKIISYNKYLKDELAKTLIENKNNTKIFECFRKLFEYKNFIKLSDFIISDTTLFVKITPSIIDIQSKYTTNIKLLSDLQDEIILVDETLIHGLKDYFDKEIIFMKEILIKQQYSNYKLLNKYVSNKFVTNNSILNNYVLNNSGSKEYDLNNFEIKTKEISRNKKSVVYVGIVLFFGLSVVCKYFLK